MQPYNDISWRTNKSNRKRRQA